MSAKAWCETLSESGREASRWHIESSASSYIYFDIQHSLVLKSFKILKLIKIFKNSSFKFRLLKVVVSLVVVGFIGRWL